MSGPRELCKLTPVAVAVATQDYAESSWRTLRWGTGWLRHSKFHRFSEFSRVGGVPGDLCSSLHTINPHSFHFLFDFPRVFALESPDECDAATVPDLTAPECIKLKPKELRPPGLSTSLSSDVDPEPMRVPIVATPTRAVVFDMRMEFKFKELRPPGPSFGLPASDDDSEPAHESHESHDTPAKDESSPQWEWNLGVLLCPILPFAWWFSSGMHGSASFGCSFQMMSGDVMRVEG
ncbi:uncharacterized protein EI90DRAFT_3291987 [Cantharellus anzutake]|uniref:uncharacterized protein n=1 Tax=Cantharellus anzutake TaxID=1750568 RepID=UPI001905EBC5|nr:uncharacterized protein EI90DRAFT_3291987 [Cantharellus anzutake]KAF8324753.1 hypothetical protein EI90DRAFT_3291987 [Cantharellus anzutake]